MPRFKPGPGFLVTAAFIGPGTVVTASRAGAGYGTTLLWAVLFSVFATIVLQDMAARVGIAGRRSLAEAIRDSLANPAVRVAALGLIAFTILIGNAAFQTGNLLGASLGLSLLSGVPAGLLVLIVGVLAGSLLMTGTYKIIQNALVVLVGLMSVVFFLVAILSAPSLGELLSGFFIPRIPSDPEGLLTVMALIGTTVVSYNLFLHTSATLERWPDEGAERREHQGEPAGHPVRGRARGPHHGGGGGRGNPPPRTGRGCRGRSHGRRSARTPARARRPDLLRHRTLCRRSDFGDHRAARRRLRGGGSAGLGGGPEERPDPPALGLRPVDRDVLRDLPRRLALPDHPVRAGWQRGSPPPRPDPAAGGGEPEGDHGQISKLADGERPRHGRNLVVAVISGLALFQLARLLGLAG